jgi:hypothetical protein
MNANEIGKGPYETYTDVANASTEKTADCKHNRQVSLNSTRNSICMSILTLKMTALRSFETLTICDVSRRNIPQEFRNLRHSDRS